MNSLKEYIRKHIPETICVCVTVCIFVVMSAYAIVLYCQMISQDKNTFEEDVSVVTNTEIIAEDTENAVYNGGYYAVGNGKKYHTSDCSYVRNGSTITEVSLQQIEEKKLEPCSKCIK